MEKLRTRLFGSKISRQSRQTPSGTSPNEPPLLEPFPYGVKVLHDSGNAIADICFIHGLTGNRDTTWTAAGQPTPWPATLLPPRLPAPARILTYGYDAYVVSRRKYSSSNRLADHAANLVADLTADRSTSGASTRPLIFVVHSLGGLVCKEALLYSQNTPESHLRSIFECTRGIIFMGTPHRGSWMARWATIPASAFGIITAGSTSTNKPLLHVLEADDQFLESIQTRFWSMMRGLPPGRLETTCFFEELPLPVGGTVVAKGSATLEGYAAFSIYANHSDMVKFASPEDNGFKRLLGELARWTQQINDEVEGGGGLDVREQNRGSLTSQQGGSMAGGNVLDAEHGQIETGAARPSISGSSDASPSSDHKDPLASSALHSPHVGPQFNAFGGVQNINTGSGHQFSGASFSGPVSFGSN